jgi:hypothetical protein
MLPLVMTLGLTLATGGAVKVEPRTVTKSSVYLVKSPSFLAPRVSRAVLRGEQVQVEVPGRGSWFAAQVEEQRGYIHVTYLNDRPGAFKVTGEALQGESLINGNYNLAVGGFTESAVSVYRGQHPDVEEGFRRLEAFMPADPSAQPAMPDPDALGAFVTAGGLRDPGGEP